jgi:hypothetical protein
MYSRRVNRGGHILRPIDPLVLHGTGLWDPLGQITSCVRRSHLPAILIFPMERVVEPRIQNDHPSGWTFLSNQQYWKTSRA